MVLKEFNRSGVKITRLGFGAWGIGKSEWIGADDNESKKVLLRAIDEGINFFDTALAYGRGHSEKLVGEAEKESGKEIFIASKIPSKKREWPAEDESTLEDSYPPDYIRSSVERSLKNLKRDHIDLMQFHVWNDKWADRDEWKTTIEQLKKEGKVKFWGISVNDHQPNNGIEAGKSGLIDSYQVIFNLFEQSPLDKLYPFCVKNNIAFIARVPFDEGALTGSLSAETTFPEGDFRNDYFRGERKKQIIERIKKIMLEVGHEAESIAETALRFILSFEGITTVIPGIRKEKNLVSNLASCLKGEFPPDLIDKLKQHRWDKNFYV